jgi:hypothetical protein
MIQQCAQVRRAYKLLKTCTNGEKKFFLHVKVFEKEHFATVT